jgi:flagellin-specific chaperone FliS
MQNQQVLEVIGNLKGRRNYEEKKSQKLGFDSLYDYIEDKLKKASEAKKEEKMKTNSSLLKKNLSKTTPLKKQSSCSCC